MQIIFRHQWVEIFNSPDSPDDAEIRFRFLFYKYQITVDSISVSFRYAFAFLMKLPFEDIKRFALPLPPQNYTLHYWISKLLPFAIYYSLVKDSREKAYQARTALRSIMPSVYDSVEKKRYRNIMAAYVNEGLEPQ